MSDAQPAPDWWLGADGKWYPPVAHANEPPSHQGGEDPLAHPPGESDAQRRVGKVWWLIAAAGAVLILIVLVAVLLLRSSSSDTYALGGTFLLKDGSIRGSEGDPCSGEGGYDDIRSGANVVVRDGEGKTLASGQLGGGRQVYTSLGRTENFFYCEFPIQLGSEVPERDFYTVEVSRRGAITYSFDDMEQMDWQLSLSLG